MHLILILAAALYAAAADLPKESLGEKGNLVLSDDFNRDELGPRARSPIPAFSVADGLLKGSQQRADHGGTFLAPLELPSGDVILELRFRFEGARSLSIACDDRAYKGTHAGHISRIAIRPNRLLMYDDKEGVMRNDIYELRKSGDAEKKSEGDRLAADATASFPLKLEQDKWYQLGLEIVGQEMRVTIDGEPVGYLKSKGLAHATKPDLRMSAWGEKPSLEVHVDDLQVWAVGQEAAPSTGP